MEAERYPINRNMPVAPAEVQAYFAEMGIDITFVMGQRWLSITKRLKKLAGRQRSIGLLGLFGL